MGVWADTTNGLGLALALDVRPGRQQAQRWTVLAALRDSNRDVTDEAHPARWHDWMQWANVLQLMRGHGRHCLITATSEADDLSFDDLWLVAVDVDEQADGETTEGAAAPAGVADQPGGARGESVDAVSQAAVKISGDMNDELDLVEDDQVRELARLVLTEGAPEFVAGHELDGEPVEAAWPAAKVGVLGADQGAVTAAGWDLRPAEGWTTETLLDALATR